MKVLYFLYAFIMDVAYLLSLPFVLFLSVLSRRAREEVFERFFPKPLNGDVLLHGASAGEVRALIPLAQSLRERGFEPMFTTATLTGKIIAERYGFGSSLLPVESSFSLRAFFKGKRGITLIIGERDIWPRFMKYIKSGGGRVLIVNLIFPRLNWKRRFIFRLMKPYIDCISTRSEEDYIQLLSMGFPVVKGGNLKVLSEPSGEPLSLGVNYILFACIHGREGALIKRVCLKIKNEFNGVKFVIVPRYIKESRALMKLFEGEFKVRRWDDSKEGDWDVLIVDRFGVLPLLYRDAKAAFIGGSFVKKGGHDLLDACRHGVPVFIGPYYWNQRDVVELLSELNGGMVVKNEDELLMGILNLLKGKMDMRRGAKLCYLKLKEDAKRTVDEFVERCLKGLR